MSCKVSLWNVYYCPKSESDSEEWLPDTWFLNIEGVSARSKSCRNCSRCEQLSRFKCSDYFDLCNISIGPYSYTAMSIEASCSNCFTETVLNHSIENHMELGQEYSPFCGLASHPSNNHSIGYCFTFLANYDRFHTSGNTILYTVNELLLICQLLLY